MYNENTAPNVEVQDIFRQFAPSYLQSHKLPLQHLKVASAISFCRTYKFCKDTPLRHLKQPEPAGQTA